MDTRANADALISLLGFPGWGPLHLRLRQDGRPACLARCLQPGLHERAGRLPALLLRSCPAAEPLLLPRTGWPDPGWPRGGWPCSGCQLRYRLLWRPGAGADTRITLWRRPAGGERWSCAWPTTRLQGFTAHWCQAAGQPARHPAQPPAREPARTTGPTPVPTRDARGLGLRPSSDWQP